MRNRSVIIIINKLDISFKKYIENNFFLYMIDFFKFNTEY